MGKEYREECFHTDLGEVIARRYTDRIEYRGIRYARAERWHAPVSIDSFSMTPKYPGDDPSKPYDALENGGKCFQKHWKESEFYGKEFYVNPDYDVPETEDCLFLNITVPVSETMQVSEGRHGYPVAIWYHGGAFQNGYNCEAEFDGEGLAKRGILLVTVNYRLNMFGYFCHPQLIKRDGRTGNYGLMDQLLALDWVKRHIASFGGDPQRISIFGQSAGSSSVECMLSSPLVFDAYGQSKISGAILQSGITGAFSGPLPSMQEKAEAFASAMEQTGQTFNDFENMPPETLYQWGATLNLTGNGLGFSFGPVVDNDVLTSDPALRGREGKLPPISYMAGCCSNDILVNPGPMPDGKLAEGIAAFLNERRKEGNSVYYYFFAHPLPGDDAGAFHSAELWFVFSTTSRSWRPFTETEKLLQERVATDWADFFRDGSPCYLPYDGSENTIRRYE